MLNDTPENFSALAVMVPVAGVLSETFIARQIERLAPGNTVILASRVENEERLPAGVPVFVNKGVIELTRNPLIDSEIIEFLKKHRISHILAHFGDTSLKIVELNSRSLRLPIFVHFHGYDASMSLRNPATVDAYQRMGQLVTGVVAVSTQMAGRLIEIGVPESKIKICPYGVEIPQERVVNQPSGHCRFLSVGRLVRKKAPLLTLKAFKLAKKSVPDITLDLIGDGPLGGEVRNFVEENNLSSSVTLHGARSQEYVKEQFKKASVFIQHSITDPRTGDAEGLPNTILEAGSFGLPVVSTTHEGIADAVVHGETGFLVREFHVEDMAAQMIRMARNSNLRESMGKKARDRISNYYNLGATSDNLRSFIFNTESGVKPFESSRYNSNPEEEKMVNHLIDQCLLNLKSGDLPQAISLIEKASQTGEVVRNLEYVKGLCYMAAEDSTKARAAMESELTRFPDNDAAREMLSTLTVEKTFIAADKPQTLSEIQEKRKHEIEYWNTTYKEAGQKLQNGHYEFFYTTLFGNEKDFYREKRILDIGCGPRGSLEWADVALERVGLDPLADSYAQFGTRNHKMDYVTARSEEIPFPDNHFDVVCSFNSLDHVDDLPKTIEEIKRVTRSGGCFLLITDVNHSPTRTEPLDFGWEIVDRFEPEFVRFNLQQYEKGANGIYNSIKNERRAYDHRIKQKRYGILCAAFMKSDRGIN